VQLLQEFSMKPKNSCVAFNLQHLPQIQGDISLFMKSSDQNYKFIGVGLLQNLLDFADSFQSIIIDCLDHPDPTIRLRTLGLLHVIANESNAQIIVINMLKFFKKNKNGEIWIGLHPFQVVIHLLLFGLAKQWNSYLLLEEI
jgi:hypothetical protein